MRAVPHPRRRSILAAAVSIVVVAILFVGVFPTKGVLAQRAAIVAAEEQLRTVEAHNDELQARVDALHTSAEIERIAREQYNLVFPGEEAYALLPVPPPPVPVPDAWPFRGLRVAVAVAAPAG
jgi:cell division protein FtsB